MSGRTPSPEETPPTDLGSGEASPSGLPAVDPLRPAARLRILSALNGLPPTAQITLERLRRLVDIADTPLERHLAALGDAGYLVQLVTEVEGGPRSVVLLTDAGRAVFELHLRRLRDAAGGLSSS